MFHPLIEEWLGSRFGTATAAQAQAWPEVQAGRDVLISAPTGSGKTLAAFLICIDRLVRDGLAGTLTDRTQILYVSPLKALSHDVHKNLEVPLGEIGRLADERGVSLPAIRTAVRTGDTTAAERAQHLRRPPHILVTTPESLFILLTAERSRAALSGVKTVIVDEIHAVVDDKRGAHLALSIARLGELVRQAGGGRLQRIGLSATVNPIREVAAFLEGSAQADVRIIDRGHRRALDLAVEVPRDELGAVATNDMWSEIYDRIADLIRLHRTTLVFVNTRRLAERVAHHLGERLGESAVLAHHGSLSRRLRRTAEERLKAGELHAVVATASLELGIDIGTVDLACQIGSPRSIAVALQRIGRSGHHVDPTAVPRGRIFATTRDELIECAALVRAVRAGTLDSLDMPGWPLDVLAQQIVAAAACEAWPVDALYELARSAYPYRDLPRAAFDQVIGMLSDGIATRRGRNGTFLHFDRVNGIVRGRRGARLAAITSGGAIPDNANYLVVAEPEGTLVGTVDEDFAVESLAGDVFLLGTTSWRIRRVEAGRVRVEDAHGAAPSIPFWRGEAPGRTAELSREVSEVRSLVLAMDRARALEWLAEECGLDRRGAEQLVDYLRAGAHALGEVPSQQTIVAERFFDETGGMQLVLHAPFGARINRAWGLALRKRFCRTFNFELQAAATDNGIVISLSDQHSFPLEAVFRFLSPRTAEEVLTQALLDSPMFTARWRWNASRALAILRFAGGRKVPPPIQRMRAEDLLAAVFPDQVACAENLTGEIRIPDHPLVFETIRDCLHEAMDVNGLNVLLEGIEQGRIRTLARETTEPSPFSHEILNANPYAFLDDAPLEERRARAVQMRRTLGPEVGEIGALDPIAIAEVAAESWPVARDAEELHDALLTLAVVPAVPDWKEYFADLCHARRATALDVDRRALWAAAERLTLVRAAYPGVPVSPLVAPVGGSEAVDRESAVTEIVRGWLESSGPVTSAGLAARLGLPVPLIDGALGCLEAEGQVLRGHFTAAAGTEVEWCNRRLLARIHRLTLNRLRREIEPVSALEFLRFLLQWQHVVPASRLHGIEGTLQVLKQLQGYEISAAAWEREILRRRIARYDPELLDRLCLSGEVMWARLSPHPAFTAIEAGTDDPRRARRRVRPTRTAPVAIFLRDDAPWLLSAASARAAEADRRRHDAVSGLSHAAREVLDALTRRGASFIRELVPATGRLASEVEDGLWELSAAGLVTADGFDNLRSLIDPKRRRGEGRAQFQRPRHAAGRWTLLETGPHAAGGADAGAWIEAFARQLLRRWGVVFRDLLGRETLAPPWRDLLMVLRRLEARGEVRGGRFIAGFVGEQFARPEAVEALRALRRSPETAIPAAVAAADPLNLAGILLPGPRISALAGVQVDLPAAVAAAS
jgi:ATP-dependent Lhr-like helicase